VKEDELISTNMFFPSLPISTSSKAFSLDFKFNNWDKVASKKEIFGLSH
jgi:hypothetical protein